MSAAHSVFQRRHGRVSDGLYRRVFEHATNGVLILDGDSGKVADANTAFIHLTGRRLNACIGKSLWEIGVFPDAEAVEAMLRELQEHRSVRRRVFMIATNERQLEAELSARRYTVDGWRVIQCDIRDASLDTRDLHLFRALLDKASDAFEVVDQGSLRFIYANEAASRMHGYSRDEFLLVSVHDLDPSIDHQQLQHINETLREKRSVVFETIHKRKNGSEFPVEVHVSLVSINGKDWRLAMVRDISERRKSESDLQLFRTLLDSASDAIEVIDPETLRYIDVNDAACRHLGYSRDELLGLSVWDVDPGMGSVPMDRVKAALQKGRSLVHESFHRRKDGSTFPVEVVVSQVQLDSTYNIAVARDISERKQTELALKESEDAYRTLAENIPGLVYRLIDRKRARMQFFNERLVQITGYTADELPDQEGVMCSIEPLILAEDRAGIEAEISRATAEGRPFMLEYRLRHKRGDTRWMIEYGTPICGKDGSLLYIDGVIFDNTERKHQEEILRQNLEQSILTIAGTVEARDPYTAGHQRRVGELAMSLAREMELPEEQVQGIYLASLIHDLGKIHIPAEILSKPGRLSEVEYLMIKMHPQAGYDIVKNVKFPWPIADIILQHHERLDGSGYPQGLKEEQILIEARVIAVADVVESMTSHRPYRPGLGLGVALAEVEQQRGTRYDARVVDACLKLFRQDGYVLRD